MANYVRLRPRSGKKSGPKFPVRYTFQGVRFDAERGWYRLEDDAFARTLAELRIDEMDPESPRIFNVCTEEEALAIQASERRSKTRRDVEDAGGLQAISLDRAKAGPARDRSTDSTMKSNDARPRNVRGEARENNPDSTMTTDDAKPKRFGRGEATENNPESTMTTDDAKPTMMDPDPNGDELAIDASDTRLEEIGRLDSPETDGDSPSGSSYSSKKASKIRTRSTRGSDE